MHDVFSPSKTSEPSAAQETLPDLLRSNSYSLTRGGKVISSRPWSFHETKGISDAMKRASCESQKLDEESSSDSESSSSSAASSGDEQMIDKNETELNALEKEFDHFTAEEESTLVEDGVEETENTDSEETESTVIARSVTNKELSNDLVDQVNDSSPLPDEGDTLSSASGDLSFENEVNQVREKETKKDDDREDHVTLQDSQLSRSFEFYSAPTIDNSDTDRLPETKNKILFNKAKVSSRSDVIDLKESSGGVFCLSGFPLSELNPDCQLRNSSSMDNRYSQGVYVSKEELKSDRRESKSKLPVTDKSASVLRGKNPSSRELPTQPKIGGRPPIPSSIHQNKNLFLHRKQQQNLEKHSFTNIPERSFDGTHCCNTCASPPILRAHKTEKESANTSSLNGKIIINSTCPSRCKVRMRSGEDSHSCPLSSSSRKSQWGRGTDSPDCFIRCSTPSGALSDGVCSRNFSPSRSHRYSLETAAFPGIPSDCAKGRAFLNEEPVQRHDRQIHSKHEEPEDLSDVSSGATSEDSSTRSASKITKKEGDWSSPMLTGLLEGHVTRLATPPDSRITSQFSVKSTCEDVGVHSRHYRPRPPPAPRPRTLEGNELIQRHTRVYSPSFHHSRDSSLERNGRESSCDRNIHSNRVHPHHYHHPCTNHSTLRERPHFCLCEEYDDYDSCDERQHSHRHSYHEGLHNAHLFTPLRPHPKETRRHGNGISRRSVSPCFCHYCMPMGSLTNLADSCSRRPMALPYSAGKVGPDSKENFSESDYIPLWSCHSPLNVEERLLQLEGDKESLQLQVSVLTEQVEAQTEKIHDLENLLEQKKALLARTEEQLQKELIVRSTLETQRLEFLSEISNLKLRQAASERENLDLRDKVRLAEISTDHTRSQSFSPTAASTPLHSFHNIDTPSDARKTPPPNARRKIEHFGTMPRQQRDLNISLLTSPGTCQLSSTTGRPPKGVVFGKGLNAFVTLKGEGKRSTSAPNLAETEKQIENNNKENHTNSPYQDMKPEPFKGTASVAPLSSHRSPSVGHKPTGIKKIFTRLRRSSSGHLENDGTDNGDLRRGGLRATATARLGWTSQTGLFREPQLPFSSWSAKHIEEWLSSLGLSQYCAAAKCWMESGNHIAFATPHQLEKDIGVRHPLHRKKLQLAIMNRMSENNRVNKCCAKLDSPWVLRWLDDLGLPQYKDVFSESRVDGLVLNYLTYDDLSFLRISNLLHVSSLKRGIQVLREHNFDPSVLKRRSAPEEEKHSMNPSEVALWTNHRVMEWLKTVDLSEYAPNLRGSGVHGALMVYEIRFTSEFLASLLSISSSKTLLRRHLSTHFKELIGREVVQAKRELQMSPGYIPLSTTAKVKMPRKSQFSLKRKKTKTDLEFDDLICPLDELPPKIPLPLNNANKENPVDIN